MTTPCFARGYKYDAPMVLKMNCPPWVRSILYISIKGVGRQLNIYYQGLSQKAMFWSS